MLAKRYSRLLALLTLLCYGGFSLVGSCLHVHSVAEESESVPAVSAAVRDSAPAAPTKGTTLRAAPKTVHCLACDWQAANVSAAIAPVHFVFAYLPQTDNPVAAPRAPSASVASAASRGPPSA